MIPGMRHAAVLATPPFFLHFQPFGQPCFLDDFHVSQYALPVRVLYIRSELSHKVAGFQFTALNAEFIAFPLGTSLDATGSPEASLCSCWKIPFFKVFPGWLLFNFNPSHQDL